MNTAGPRELVGSHQLQSPAKERQTLPGVPMASRPKTGTGHTSNESLCCAQKIELKSIFLCTQTSRKHDQEAKDYTILLYRRYRPENNNELLSADITLKKTCDFRKELKGSQLLSADIHVVLWTQSEVNLQATNLKFVTCRMDLTIRSPEPNRSRLIVPSKGLSDTEKLHLVCSRKNYMTSR